MKQFLASFWQRRVCWFKTGHEKKYRDEFLGVSYDDPSGNIPLHDVYERVWTCTSCRATGRSGVHEFFYRPNILKLIQKSSPRFH